MKILYVGSLIAMLIVSIWMAYGERHNKRWWVSFVAGALFFGSVGEIGKEIIRWLHR